jgi:hypothetical protein
LGLLRPGNSAVRAARSRCVNDAIHKWGFTVRGGGRSRWTGVGCSLSGAGASVGGGGSVGGGVGISVGGGVGMSVGAGAMSCSGTSSGGAS